MSNPVRILHVDDDADFLDLAREILERQVDLLTVESVTSSKAGLDHLSRDQFDCVLSDYDMPGQNGLEFLESVRELDADLPFILFTGKGSEEIASEAISQGVTDYVQKKAGVENFALVANRVLNAVEQSRSQEDAELTKQRLRELAECSDDILWMVSGDWSEVLFINSAYEAIWGRSAEALRTDASDFLDGVHPDDRPAVQQAMERLSNGDPIEIEFHVNETENFGRRVWVSGKPIFDDQRSVVRIAGYARDITGRLHERRVPTPS